MKLFKWSDFLKESLEDIESICKKYDIENYTIKDGLVNVDGGVDLYDKGLNSFNDTSSNVIVFVNDHSSQFRSSITILYCSIVI